MFLGKTFRGAWHGARNAQGVSPSRAIEAQEWSTEPFSVEGFAGSLPVVAVSLHAAHAVRPEVAEYLAISPLERQREEDVAMDVLAGRFATKIVTHRSRFEVDLNRPPSKAVYLQPSDAWGLHVWRSDLPEGVVGRSLGIYRAFYRAVREAFDELALRHQKFVVLDIHSYNHRRAGPNGPASDPRLAPEVNIGTRSMERTYWSEVVNTFMQHLSRGASPRGALDVRENVNFFGGSFPTWVHQQYPRVACTLAVEFKKTYVDEWSGEVDEDHLDVLGRALLETLPPVVRALGRLR